MKKKIGERNDGITLLLIVLLLACIITSGCTSIGGIEGGSSVEEGIIDTVYDSDGNVIYESDNDTFQHAWDGDVDEDDMKIETRDEKFDDYYWDDDDDWMKYSENYIKSYDKELINELESYEMARNELLYCEEGLRDKEHWEEVIRIYNIQFYDTMEEIEEYERYLNNLQAVDDSRLRSLHDLKYNLVLEWKKHVNNYDGEYVMVREKGESDVWLYDIGEDGELIIIDYPE